MPAETRLVRHLPLGPALFALAALTLSSGGCSGAPEPALAESTGSTAAGDGIQSTFIHWALPAGAEAYADLDGHRMLQDVVAQAEIARRYRDQGHPQFWGRIIGSSADTESAAWLETKFKDLGLTDVRTQKLDLLPQWYPQSWKVTVTSGSKTIELASAQPAYRTPGTPSAGLELDAAYVGLGSEADFAGRDVKGKAAFVFSGGRGARAGGGVDNMKRANDKGAAVIFDVLMMPGNLKYQSYPKNTNVPTFTLGGDDGIAVREMIESAGGRPVRVSVKLDVQMVPNLQTALVWGTLPGASDETIYIIAHRDGWFDAAGDNAAGVASMLALVEHYAKIPQAQRPRTIRFIGTDGHHNTGDGAAAGTRWLAEHRDELFAKTALMLNAEHPSTVETRIQADKVVTATTYTAQEWYAGGPSRPELQRIAVNAFREFGVSLRSQPNPAPPAGDLGRFYKFLPGVATSDFFYFFHTDMETPDAVPWTGLEGSTRAYARIIDEVNKLPLSDVQRPTEE